jgi:hypothetical protein
MKSACSPTVSYRWQKELFENGVSAFEQLTELQRHVAELKSKPSDWMPWNYRDTLTATIVSGHASYFSLMPLESEPIQCDQGRGFLATSKMANFSANGCPTSTPAIPVFWTRVSQFVLLA